MFPTPPQNRRKTSLGFSLIELMVVMVIVAILATQVIYSFTSPVSKVKGGAFNLRSDLNYARSEAVNRNLNVAVEFLINFSADLDGDGDTDDGYRIWVDVNGNNSFDSGTDTLLRTVALPDGAQYYSTDLSAKGGPTKEFDNSGSFSYPSNGISFSGSPPKVVMRPDGTSNVSGAAHIFMSKPAKSLTGAATDIQVPPYAVIVASTGRVRLLRWKTEYTEWRTK